MTGPIEALIELARGRCDLAAKAVVEQLAGQRAARLKDEMLVQYRGEYLERQARTTRAGTDGATLRNLAGFLAKLDEARAQSARELAEMDARVARARIEWSAAKRKLEGYLALQRRDEGRRAVRARRSEQRQQDEFAARSARDHTGESRR